MRGGDRNHRAAGIHPAGQAGFVRPDRERIDPRLPGRQQDIEQGGVIACGEQREFERAARLAAQANALLGAITGGQYVGGPHQAF